jgi:hypothetical protein
MLFFGDFQQIEVERGARDNLGAIAGGLDGRIEHWMHDSVPLKWRHCANREQNHLYDE